jgi:cytochrome c biogenesis protein
MRLTKIISWLSSLTFTIIVLSGLVGTALVNIVLVNCSYTPEKYVSQDSRIICGLIEFFYFSDLNYSWWFRALLILFAVNLVLCIFKQIPRTLATIRRPDMGATTAIPGNLPCAAAFSVPAAGADAMLKLEKSIAEKITRPSVTRVGDTTLLFSHRGRYSFFGFYISHVGLLCILLGIIISRLSHEVNGNLYLCPGQSTDIFSETIDSTLQVNKLPFSIMLDRLEQSSDKGYGDRKKIPYKGTVTVLEHGQKVKTAELQGYETLTYKNMRVGLTSTLQQTSNLITLSVTPKKAGGRESVFSVRENNIVTVSGTGQYLMVKNVIIPQKPAAQYPDDPDFLMSIQKIPEKIVRLELYGENGQQLRTASVPFKGAISFSQTWGNDYEFAVLDIKTDPVQGTDLAITIESGADIIWAGTYLAIIGFPIMFLCAFQKIWVKIEKKEALLQVTLAGWSSRNQGAVNALFNTIKTAATETDIT